MDPLFPRRTGGTLGDVVKRHVITRTGPDKNIGRAILGFSDNDKFTQLPLGFDGDPLTMDEWRRFVPRFKNLPAAFLQRLSCLLASRVCHATFLEETGTTHILFEKSIVY